MIVISKSSMLLLKGLLEKRLFSSNSPRSGGLVNDIGYLVKDNEKYKVTNVYFDKESGDVIHILNISEHNIKEGDSVCGVVDWDRRYRIIRRLYTAAHILAAIMYRDYGALITGGNIYPDYAYDDYSPERFDPEIFKEAIRKANEVVKKSIEDKIYWLKREEALKILGIVKLAQECP